MGGDSSNGGDASALLEQLELILDHDRSIDEVGFIHPSQFATLAPPAKLCKPSEEDLSKGTRASNSVQFDERVFWYSDHKLAISVDVLSRLYGAALHAYKDAIRSYKAMISGSGAKNALGDATPAHISDEFLEREVLRHSRALLVVSSDYTTAWNSRKLVLSRKMEISLFMDEFHLSALILSYSPKSEYAWSHRRWVIRKIAEKFQNLREIVDKESELVKKIAEKSKMNYRAWNHRCWLIYYMTREQVHDELSKSRKWAELHVADNSCFHYHRQLMLTMLDYSIMKHDGEAFIKYKTEVYFVWKEELKWNELLIKRYVGREALWIHRRFLSQCWIKYFMTNQQDVHASMNNGDEISPAVDLFLGEELQLFYTCLNISADEFDDTQTQAQHAAFYILWISKQIPTSHECQFRQRLEELGGLKAILIRACPEKTALWGSLLN